MKRRALGDLHNKQVGQQQEKKTRYGSFFFILMASPRLCIFVCLRSLEKEKKNGLITAVYKDVKPRVDTRWKRSKELAPIIVKESVIKKDTAKAVEIIEPLQSEFSTTSIK